MIESWDVRATEKWIAGREKGVNESAKGKLNGKHVTRKAKSGMEEEEGRRQWW